MRDDRDHGGGPTAASRPPPGLTRGVREVRVSVSRTGGQSNDVSTDPAISGDGGTVAFFPSPRTSGRATPAPAASTTR